MRKLLILLTFEQRLGVNHSFPPPIYKLFFNSLFAPFIIKSLCHVMAYDFASAENSKKVISSDKLQLAAHPPPKLESGTCEQWPARTRFLSIRCAKRPFCSLNKRIFYAWRDVYSGFAAFAFPSCWCFSMLAWTRASRAALAFAAILAGSFAGSFASSIALSQKRTAVSKS